MRPKRLIDLGIWSAAVVGTLIGALLVALAITVARDPATDTTPTALTVYVGTLIGVPSFLLLFVQLVQSLRRHLRPANPLARLRTGVRDDLEDRLKVMRLREDDVDLRYAFDGRGRGVRLDEAAQVHTSVGRVVFVGPGGAGKSYSALRVAMSILRESESQIPVVVPLSRWNAEREFSTWLCDFIAAEWRLTPDTVRELLNDGRLVPILDGLDEADREGEVTIADGILSQLVAWRVLDSLAPFILTCRSAIWHQLRTASTSHASLKVFTVKPVDITDAKAFASRGLALAGVPSRGGDLVDALRAAGLDSIVRSPWQLTMACTITEADDIASAVRSGRQGTMVERFVDTTASRAVGGGLGRVRMSLDLWWLAAYARYLKQNRIPGSSIDEVRLDASDLELARLWPVAGRNAPRYVDFCLAALLSAPGLIWGVAYLWHRGLLVRIALVVCVLVWLRLMARTTLKAWVPAATQDLSRLGDPKFLLRQTAVALVLALVATTVFGPLVGLVVFLTVWFAVGLTVGFGQTLATDSSAHVVGPRGVLRRERRISRTAAWTLAPLLAIAFSQSWGWAAGVVFTTVYCAAVGETVGCALWRRYLAMILASRLQFSPTPAGTLERLHDIGLVRVAGMTYQFRQEELLDHFAKRQSGPFALLRR